MKLLKKTSLLIILTYLIIAQEIKSKNCKVEIANENNKNLYPTDISFCICDAKFRDGEIKILEFGEGNRSRFKGYDALHQENGGMWKNFWKALAQFNLPVWYIGPQLEGYEDRQKEVSYKAFKEMGGIAVDSIENLKINKEFLATSNKDLPKDITKISDYKGILIFRHRHGSSTSIVELRKEFPGFITLNRASSFYINNKLHTAHMFDNKLLKKFRPQCKIYKKDYHNAIGQQIINDLNSCNLFVIKPINAFKGDGIIMTKGQNLQTILKHILLKTPNVMHSKNPAFNHWANDNNSHFLIEEYVQSKILALDGQLYDPTMRIVFTMHYDQGCMNINFLGGYWKLPAKALNEKGTLIEKGKSKIVTGRASSIKISPADMLQAQELLQDALPLLYLKMLHQRNRSWQDEQKSKCL